MHAIERWRVGCVQKYRMALLMRCGGAQRRTVAHHGLCRSECSECGTSETLCHRVCVCVCATLELDVLRKMHIDNYKVNLCQHILHQMIFSA